MLIPPDPEKAADFDWDDILAYTTLLAQFRKEKRALTMWKADNDAVVLHIVSGLPDGLAAVRCASLLLTSSGRC